ncbi:MAG TPA: M12 family metallo-peptidase, partial [Pyrinomonadaceae bacterium]|nr:M12 family metallo-peptidase [Pyrinomonadaceae bacterium]
AGENPTDIHVLYEEKVLKVSPSFECDVIEPPSTLPNSSSQNPEAATNSCVRVYLEADHGLFLNKGTVANTASYLTGVFNQSAALFSNDGVSVSISEITVWNSPSPFTGFDSNAVLEQFQDIRTSFNGDLAHLITLDRGFGGIAFRDVLCNRGFAYGVSDIDATFSNVPTYSWSVGVITHELGHNLGSRHTHACAWNGNNTAIDGCNPPEGTCSRPGIPTNGGTIMSYCHLTSAGINFTFGFGPQPRDVITNRVNASSCLTTCGSTVLPAPTANAATSVTNNSFTANWSSVSNATGYRLDVSTNSSFSSFLSGFNNLDVGNVLSRSVTGLNPGTTYFYRVRAFNSSGTSGNSTTITVVTVPAAPVAKTATGVTGSSFTANWNSASGATGYRLDVSTSSSFSSFVIGYNNLEMGNTLSGSVTGLSPATTYFYRVRAYNSNGISGNSLSITTTTAQGFTITVTASPAAGGTVSGGGTFPAGSSRTVQAVANSGFSFRNWTEGAFIISTFPSFTFPLGFDRNLVANFTETTTADAVYDNVLRVPKCGQVGSVCDSGFLLNGRDSISGGQEPNQPNTLHNSCADNTRGSYHVDQSIDKIVVSTLDGSNFAPGKTVKVEVTVWTLSPSTDFLDLFYAPDATNPNWTYLLSLVPSGVGPRVLTAAFPLAQGRNVQAIRANFLSGGFPDACSGGAPDNFDDHDDLAFTVENGGPPLQLVLEQSGPSSTQAAAMETLFRTRDPFAILKPTLLNPSLDKNTRIAVFAANLQLSPGQPPSVVVVNLVDKNNQSFDVTAEAVAPLLGSPFSQVIFRLPTNLASGVCTIAIKAHGQTSNAGTIRIQ